MDLVDLIILLFILGAPLLQLLTRKKGDSPEVQEEEWGSEQEPGGYQPKRDISDPNREFEDLMEALGNPQGAGSSSREPSVFPSAPEPGPSAPPPLPAREPEPAPVLDPRVARMNEALRERARREEPGRPSREREPVTESISRLARPRRSERSRIRHVLSDRSSIRDAIVINEILGKPVSTRS